MEHLFDIFQTADWKQEKQVLVIELLDAIIKGEKVNIKVSVGKEITHPNTTEHQRR